MTDNLTQAEIETIAATTETLETLVAGAYKVVVQSNPFHGILDEEPRFYVVVLTADGTVDDSHSANTMAAASRKARSLHKRLYREGFAII